MRFVVDEMFSPATARHLRQLGHDARHVSELGLQGAPDAQVAAVARGEQRALITENVADFADKQEVVVVCVLKRDLPAGGAQPQAMAELLDRWATANPRPYLGQHWPG